MKLKLFGRIAASLSKDGCFWNADAILPESPALAEVYKAAREEWSVQLGTNLTNIHAKLGASSTQGYSSQDQLAS